MGERESCPEAADSECAVLSSVSWAVVAACCPNDALAESVGWAVPAG
jgi:hypothetical protein